MAIKISKNFTLDELCASKTATAKKIDKKPGNMEIVNLCALVYHVLQPLRDWWGKSISISSGYRCQALNSAVSGVKNSQHLRGQAADIDIKGDLTIGKKLFEYIRKNLDFDQLIWEHNASGTYWIHVSYNILGNRHQVISDLLKK